MKTYQEIKEPTFTEQDILNMCVREIKQISQKMRVVKTSLQNDNFVYASKLAASTTQRLALIKANLQHHVEFQHLGKRARMLEVLVDELALDIAEKVRLTKENLESRFDFKFLAKIELQHLERRMGMLDIIIDEFASELSFFNE